MPAALLVLFLAAGLRTPLLAALALRRVRNLALVALPYGVGLLLVPLLAQGIRVPDRAGLIAVALAPALLSGPALAARLGGRIDRAGALLLGTIVVAFALGLREGGGAASTVQAAAIAFVVGGGVTSAVPMLPAAARRGIQWLGELAFVAILAVGATRIDEIGPSLFATAALFGATVLTAAIAARIGGVDLTSALLGAGTRDPAVAVAIALAAGGSTVVPVAYAALSIVFLTVVVLVNRRKPR
ncbi:MAG TPA: hypothetical protein VGA38_10830 [Candidatus Limnocylindria bacterium]